MRMTDIAGPDARIALTLPLGNPAADLATVGGKGASLARLVAAGLPVPDGFHVTTSSYRRFVREAGLGPLIEAGTDGIDGRDPKRAEQASEAIGAVFAGAAVPDDVRAAVLEAYAALPGPSPAVAVRSSATAEDLPELSFAGQQETYLNIRGGAAVLDAVRRCWASLWTPRAIMYRARADVPADGVAMAVVVQGLVPADAAGILFTVNPASGRRDEMVVNAAWGLGEAVVGGLVTPDEVVVDRGTGAVRARRTGHKAVMTVRVEGGSEERPVPPALRDQPVLDDAAASELAALALRIERLFGRPMDIEWARSGTAFAILQARPITALPEPAPAPPAGTGEAPDAPGEGAAAARETGEARADLGRLARDRRARRESRKRLVPPPTVPVDYRFKVGPFDLSSTLQPKGNTAEGNTLEGFAVSPGRVTAPASVVLSPADFGKMRPDTILVCPTTTPAWTPLFAQARGLVTDIGGVLAHGSIVAREYGIPAVMGTTVATTRIRDGQLLTLDGTAGTVEIHPG